MIQERLCYLKDRVAEIVEYSEHIQLFNNPLFCDFKVKCYSETFYVSKCCMAQKSPVFASMFTSGMKEAINGELELHDDVDTVKAMLLFIHHNKKVKDIDLAMKVIQLAQLYDIKLLREQCELFLMQNIQSDRAEECQTLAKSLDMGVLAFKCLEITYSNFEVSDINIEKDSVDDVRMVKEVFFKDNERIGNMRNFSLKGADRFVLHLHNQTNFNVKFCCGFEGFNFRVYEVEAESDVKHVVRVNRQKMKLDPSQKTLPFYAKVLFRRGVLIAWGLWQIGCSAYTGFRLRPEVLRSTITTR
ncbi:unnamed protein product [Bursaphelenchus okinawaensis]|uniref:BTB domain-containing protein n=1 Tax=Bursaphelenchus okinawaensis TaxID=465554 RepID=A0A811JRL9_9BILA|nr:unnamed protein product [Bursaphelenchus okinawaensis]CAG9079367.1 unnamed protein product [Bursaphelenchus okinawaensis]